MCVALQPVVLSNSCCTCEHSVRSWWRRGLDELRAPNEVSRPCWARTEHQHQQPERRSQSHAVRAKYQQDGGTSAAVLLPCFTRRTCTHAARPIQRSERASANATRAGGWSSRRSFEGCGGHAAKLVSSSHRLSHLRGGTQRGDRLLRRRRPTCVRSHSECQRALSHSDCRAQTGEVLGQRTLTSAMARHRLRCAVGRGAGPTRLVLTGAGAQASDAVYTMPALPAADAQLGVYGAAHPGRTVASDNLVQPSLQLPARVSRLRTNTHTACMLVERRQDSSTSDDSFLVRNTYVYSTNTLSNRAGIPTVSV